MPADITWRAPFDNRALNVLHAQAFGIELRDVDWREQLERHSLGWACAYSNERLVGFVNLAWDGDRHAFLLDLVVAEDAQGEGLGTALVQLARAEAARAGCEWLHVDFESPLNNFYIDACGLIPTFAGISRL